jgi:hypothetical protein
MSAISCSVTPGISRKLAKGFASLSVSAVPLPVFPQPETAAVMKMAANKQANDV